MTTLEKRPNTALLVIDVQNGVEGEAPDAGKIMEDPASAEDPIPDRVPFFPLKPDLPR
jgi:hypothetical protein